MKPDGLLKTVHQPTGFTAMRIWNNPPPSRIFCNHDSEVIHMRFVLFDVVIFLPSLSRRFLLLFFH